MPHLGGRVQRGSPLKFDTFPSAVPQVNTTPAVAPSQRVVSGVPAAAPNLFADRGVQNTRFAPTSSPQLGNVVQSDPGVLGATDPLGAPSSLERLFGDGGLLLGANMIRSLSGSRPFTKAEIMQGFRKLPEK